MIEIPTAPLHPAVFMLVKRDLKRLKRSTPWLFVQYVELHNAQLELAKAQENYRRAREAWERLGE